MARLAAILSALARALYRDQKSIWSFAGNNFFIVSALTMQGAGGLIYMIVGLVILFPLSTDPLRKIPASRLDVWPLDERDRWLLRVASPWINPMTWGIGALAIWMARGKVTIGLWALFAGLVAAGFALSSLPFFSGRGTLRRLPAFPGPLNHIVRASLRATLCTLDFYCGLLLSAAVFGFRFFLPPLPPEGVIVVTVLVSVALSSYAQCLFGLDGEGGLTRYRLLPLRGWQVLAAKDAAYLLLAIPLTLPLAPLAGTGAALMSLAFGHHHSVHMPRHQVRWRFSTGGPFLQGGWLQVAAMAAAATCISVYSIWFLIPCIAAAGISAWWYGRALERIFTGRNA